MANIQGRNLTETAGTFIDMMKRLQPQKDIDRLWELKYPFLSMMRKVDDFEGARLECPWEHDHASVSRTFSDAQDDRRGSSSLKPAIERTRMYGVGRVDAETMRASRSDRGAWVRALAREQKNVLLGMRKRAAVNVWRNEGGALGQVSAIANGDGTNDRVTLTNKSDVYNFHIGMNIHPDVDDGTGSITAEATNAYIGKIDFTNGYLFFVTTDTGTTAFNYVSGWATKTGAANDYLFAKGDFGGSFLGVAAWIPLTAPSAGETFSASSIDRSVSPERLAGHRINDTSLSREEIIQDLCARMEYTGGDDAVCYMQPLQVKALALELDTKVVRDPGGQGRAGFRGITIDTAMGPVEVLSDPSIPENRLYVLDMSSWAMHHLDGFPHLVEDDGLKSSRVSDADQLEFRYRLWGNVFCSAPGRNGVAALPAAY